MFPDNVEPSPNFRLRVAVKDMLVSGVCMEAFLLCPSLCKLMLLPGCNTQLVELSVHTLVALLKLHGAVCSAIRPEKGTD